MYGAELSIPLNLFNSSIIELKSFIGESDFITACGTTPKILF